MGAREAKGAPGQWQSEKDLIDAGVGLRQGDRAPGPRCPLVMFRGSSGPGFRPLFLPHLLGLGPEAFLAPFLQLGTRETKYESSRCLFGFVLFFLSGATFLFPCGHLRALAGSHH